MRRRSRPAPTPGNVTPTIDDWEELQARIGAVKGIWVKAGNTVPIPSDDQLFDLAVHISTCAAQLIDAKRDKLDADARAAIKTLLTWCGFDPDENGLPHIVFRDQRMVNLETALRAAQSLADPSPSRTWVNAAWGIWRRVAFIMKTVGEEAGYTAGSHAVRFTSLALQWVGYPAATIDAVSMELRSDPEYRKRVLE
jgi:hypothetical protein